MIDFTTCEVNKFKAYGGANGNTIYYICAKGLLPDYVKGTKGKNFRLQYAASL